MTTRLVQLGPEQHESGTAAFQVTGPATGQLAQVDQIEIAIVQPGPTERFLDPRNPDDPWTTSVYHFRPLGPRRQGNALWLEINHGVTYHLRANQPYKLHIRAQEGAEVEEVFTGPAQMRRPSTRPEGWTPPPDPRGPLVAPTPTAPPPLAAAAPAVAEMAPEPEAAPPAAAEMPAPAPAPAAQGKKWLIPLIVLLAFSGAVAGYFLMPAGTTDVAETMDSCRKAVAAAPEPGVARAKAEALAHSGGPKSSWRTRCDRQSSPEPSQHSSATSS